MYLLFPWKYIKDLNCNLKISSYSYLSQFPKDLRGIDGAICCYLHLRPSFQTDVQNLTTKLLVRFSLSSFFFLQRISSISLCWFKSSFWVWTPNMEMLFESVLRVNTLDTLWALSLSQSMKIGLEIPESNSWLWGKRRCREKACQLSCINVWNQPYHSSSTGFVQSALQPDMAVTGFGQPFKTKTLR